MCLMIKLMKFEWYFEKQNKLNWMKWSFKWNCHQFRRQEVKNKNFPFKIQKIHQEKKRKSPKKNPFHCIWWMCFISALKYLQWLSSIDVRNSLILCFKEENIHTPHSLTNKCYLCKEISWKVDCSEFEYFVKK